MRAEVITISRDAGTPAPAQIHGTHVTGVVLAGGADERFAGTDKGLIPVGGRTFIKRALEQLLLQVRDIVIVANRHHALYGSYGYRVVPDDLAGGPLTGIAAGLAAIETSHALFVPVDAARLPTHLASGLLRAHTERGGKPCLVRAADRSLPTCCLLARTERMSVESALKHGERDLHVWLAKREAVEVDFRDWPAEFWGVRSPDQMAALEKALLR